MELTTLLWDLDGTLFDFEKNEERSLIKVFEQFTSGCDSEKMDCYRKINHQLWHDYECGLIGKEVIELTRFQKTFDQLGIEADGMAASRQYREYLKQGYDMYEDTLTVLDFLKGKLEMDVVTNGDGPTQRQRLKGTGTEDYFTHLFISDEMGVQKPAPLYFEKVLATITEKDLSRILLVGDSLHSDISGALPFGIRTCWINRKGIENSTGIHPDHQITELKELIEIID